MKPAQLQDDTHKEIVDIAKEKGMLINRLIDKYLREGIKKEKRSKARAKK